VDWLVEANSQISAALHPDWPFPSIVTSALKMETVRVSETLASTSKPTRHLNPEEHDHYVITYLLFLLKEKAT
jgi:hypothetical protein